MKIAAMICVAVIILAIIVVRILSSKHSEWLDQQSPVGSWVSSSNGAKTVIKFDGGPKEGVYKQLVEHNGVKTKELGHWHSNRNELRMLIMATDIKSHPRFGQDTVYTIRYPDTNKISIEGPDRNSTYEKSSETVVFDESANTQTSK
jgi:hypothetical protein